MSTGMFEYDNGKTLVSGSSCQSIPGHVCFLGNAGLDTMIMKIYVEW